MVIDFKEKYSELNLKDKAELSPEELGYIKTIEDYIDREIEKTLSTDRLEVWIDKIYTLFNYNPVTKKPFPSICHTRKSVLTSELLSRYENANWRITWEIDDGMDGNMSGGDYLILKGIR